MERTRDKEMMHQYSIPEDIVFEILLRLPAKSIGRFTCVSKLWARIIRSEVFVRKFSLHASQKKQQSHFLFAFNELKKVQKSPRPQKLLLGRLPAKSIGRITYLYKFWATTFTNGRLLFESNDRAEGYQEKWHLFSKSEFLSNTVCQLKKLRYNKPSYAHGLISFLNGQEQVVSNPTTGKSITLPTVSNPIFRSFLGYDPIDAKYKVLCLTNVNHQVLTLGPRPQNWRTISCSTPHHPSGTNSVCIDGVLYYITEHLLVGFDLRSETLEMKSILPQGIGSYNLPKTTLINYHGKVALVTQACRYCTFPLWVLEDAKKQDWSKHVLSFPPNTIVGDHASLKILGVSEMGEFVYAPIQFKELYVYFVDHVSNKVTSVKVRGNFKHNIRDFDFNEVIIFLNHVESLMFM